jgi:hypothetical protein
MALRRVRLADDNHHQVLASLLISVSAREQHGVSVPAATSDLVRVGQGLCHLPPVFRQYIGMPFGDVTLPLLGEFDFSI